MATVSADIDLDGLLRALAGGRSPLVKAEDLGGLWGLEPDDALDLASDLEDAGWLQTWADAPDGKPRVILSSLAAERLHIALVEMPRGGGSNWDCLWRDPRYRPPRTKVARSRQINETDLAPRGYTGSFLDELTGATAPDPAEGGGGGGPLLLHGLGLTWRGPCEEAEPVCRGCGGRPRPYGVCLICSLAGRAVRLTGLPTPRLRPQRTYAPPADGLTGGTGAASGKNLPTPRAAKAKPAGRRPARRRANVTPTTRANSFDLAKLRGGLGG